MTDAAGLAALAGRHLDLVTAPFTLPRSRVLVFRAETATACACTPRSTSAGSSECRVLDALTVVDADGAVLPVTEVLPGRVTFGGVTLTFADPSTLSIGSTRLGGARTLARSSWTGGRSRRQSTSGSPSSLSKRPGSAQARCDCAAASGRPDEEHPLGDGIRLRVAADRARRPSSRATMLRTSLPPRASGTNGSRSARSCATTCRRWPRSAGGCSARTSSSCPSLADARAIVPSKIGYVGLWQWDAYFIAVGLRHGDPELAREQLDLAFRFPQPDGQLPDVVHELGVLATSDDLPESDRANLRRAGSQIADPSAPVPLTKPPLAAWALRKVLAVRGRPRATRARSSPASSVRRTGGSRGSDLDRDGMPEYGHPYSSGLDDSPIFDGPLPTAAPDLGAYLVRAGSRDRRPPAPRTSPGPTSRGSRSARRRRRSCCSGCGMPSAAGSSRTAGASVQLSDTVVGLMPLLTGTLPERRSPPRCGSRRRPASGSRCRGDCRPSRHPTPTSRTSGCGGDRSGSTRACSSPRGSRPPDIPIAPASCVSRPSPS